MNILKDQLKILLLFPFYLAKHFIYRIKTDSDNLPGKEFAEYGYKAGLRLLIKGKFSAKLLLNPVSIVRYFEFDFVNSSIDLIDNAKILDISSPYLFGFLLSAKNNCNYNYINPDKKDLENVRSLANKLDLSGSFSTEYADARTLDYPKNIYDVVLSISVIEHVSNDDDSRVMKELWRVLKPGGLLILTFPVKNEYEEEFISENIYNLNQIETNGKFFFQRYYNDKKIEERLLSSIDNFEIVEKRVFGEITNGFYDSYKKRWVKSGYWETVKDPYYISKNFKYFPDINDLTSLGVMGLTIRKLV